MASEKSKDGHPYRQVGADRHDPFNGEVAVFEWTGDDMKDEPKRFWAEHQRKDIYTEEMTEAEANAAADGFVNDTQFA